jgi:hypothetical protein
MNHASVAAISCVALFFGMLLLVLVGRRLGRRRLQADPDTFGAGTGGVEGAVLALLGLLTAFTSSGAYTRLEARRQ